MSACRRAALTALITAAVTLTIGGVALSVNKKPWPDWPNEHIKEANFVKDKKWLLGYEDGNFRPWQPITERQVVTVAQRAGIRTDLGHLTFHDIPATMSWVENGFLPGTVYEAGPEETCTRFRFAIMLYRYGEKPGPSTEVIPTVPNPDEDVVSKLDRWLEETRVTWQGVTRKPRLAGHARTIVEESRKHNVPLWLALGQCWRESQWGTTGLSIDYNMLWGMKIGCGDYGEVKGTIRGFADYVDIDECIRAYFRYMDSGDKPYRSWIDSGDLEAILNFYAPPWDGNNPSQHYNIVATVRGWCEERGIE